MTHLYKIVCNCKCGQQIMKVNMLTIISVCILSLDFAIFNGINVYGQNEKKKAIVLFIVFEGHYHLSNFLLLLFR